MLWKIMEKVENFIASHTLAFNMKRMPISIKNDTTLLQG